MSNNLIIPTITMYLHVAHNSCVLNKKKSKSFGGGSRIIFKLEIEKKPKPLRKEMVISNINK